MRKLQTLQTHIDVRPSILYLKPHHYAATTPHTQDPFRHRLTCVQKVAAASLIQFPQNSDGGLTKPRSVLGLRRTSQN